MHAARILIILPAYNEAGKIGRVIEKLRAAQYMGDILVADDHSTDHTRAEALGLGAKVITHPVNLGVGAGIRTGIRFAIDNGYDIGVVMSGDDQHEPDELERVVGPILSGTYDFVQGSRRLPGGAVIGDRLFRMITTQLYSVMFSALAGRKITDATNGFRAFRLSIFTDPAIDLNQEWLDRYELEPYLLYRIATSERWRMIEAPITVRYHATGREYTKMRPVRDWWRLARPMFMLALGLRK